MTPATVMELGRETLMTCLFIVGPIMAVGFLIGLVISFVQAVMQMQEMTLAFVPKILAMGGALLFFGGWMLEQLMLYTTKILHFSNIISG